MTKTNDKNNEYVKYLIDYNYKLEKQKIVIRAIMEDQTKFLKTCKQKWGDEFYSEIVADC